MRESATNLKVDVPDFYESRYGAELPTISARIAVAGQDVRRPARERRATNAA
jgi:hypothetical protein